MSRPEKQAPPEVFYDDTEARKYASSSRMVKIQTEMASRAVELLELPAGSRAHLLDIGCGSGLSGEVLTALGHTWVGMDISPSMLGVALSRGVAGDLLCHDIGQGLCFRPGTFDGAISVSVIQWLCNADRSEHVPQRRLKTFFQSLYNCLKRGARAVLQFYPDNSDQMTMITEAAMACGFGGGLVVDNPESKKAKKYYLVLLNSSDGPQKVNVRPSAAASSADNAMDLGDDASSVAGDQIMFTTGRKATTNKAKERLSRRKAPLKSKEWIQNKKERMRKQGRSVARDSKYTARRRNPQF